MAKRFTDTDKWKKGFIKSLPAEYKLFWLFILDDCDHAGIWHVEMEIAEVRLGIKLSIEKIRGLFLKRVIEFDRGTKMFIPDFIDFQYGHLNPSNKAHKSVIDKLTKYNLMGHISPLQGAKDMDMDMDMDKELEKYKEKSIVEIFKIEDCFTIALKDQRWVKANATNPEELAEFNNLLESRGHYEKNPLDYKTHFSNWKRSGKKGELIQQSTAGSNANITEQTNKQKLNELYADEQN